MKTEITIYLNEDEVTKLLEAKTVVAAISVLAKKDEKIQKVAEQAYDSLCYLIHHSGREEYLNYNTQEEE